MTRLKDFVIRQARANEYAALGKLLVSAYAGLPAMPSPREQPDYYAMLENVAARAAKPALRVFVAAVDLPWKIDEAGEVA